MLNEPTGDSMTEEKAEAGLTKIGATPSTHYFTPTDERDLLIVAPNPGLIDSPDQARENVAYQTAHAQSLSGKRCGVVVQMDRLFGQDAASRQIYAEGMKPEFFFGAALVVPSPLSRAIGSFFIGLSKPPIPTRLFKSVDEALAWLRSIRGNAN